MRAAAGGDTVRRVFAGLVLAAAGIAGCLLAGIARAPQPVPAAVAWVRGARLVPDAGGVRQRGAADCGPAALAHAALRLGRPTPYPDPESPLRPGPRGCRLDEVAREAERRGLVPRLVHTDGSRPEALAPPAILHLKADHFVVLEGRTGAGDFRVHDPSLGALELPPGALRAQWSGWALELSLPGRSEP